MCDTWAALRSATLDGRVILAKNSDRPVFDCQPLLLQPRRRWPPGSRIQTGYVELPQVEETYAHLGSSPYWCWGYEEGINEWGLAIGNEAVYTRSFQEELERYQPGSAAGLGLTGMDMIRAALERCQTAAQAVDLIAGLVETYGQFGSASPGKPHDTGGYDNAFLLADPDEAWVLETTGRRWAARRIRQGTTSISNQLSIRAGWDLGSADLVEHACQKGWWPEGAPFDFAHAYINDKVPRQISHLRMMRSRQLLAERSGQVTPGWMMRIARDHYEDTFLQGPYFDAADPDFLSICMHSSPADFTWGNTASSCVAVLPREPGELPVLWWTPGPPCNGCYVPFFAQGSRLPEIVSRSGTPTKQVTPASQAPKDTFSPDSYWWLFYRLNEWVKGGPERSLPGCYAERNARVRARFDALEQDFAARLPGVMQRASILREQDPSQMAALLDEFSASCVNSVLEAIESFI